MHVGVSQLQESIENYRGCGIYFLCWLQAFEVYCPIVIKSPQTYKRYIHYGHSILVIVLPIDNNTFNPKSSVTRASLKMLRNCHF